MQRNKPHLAESNVWWRVYRNVQQALSAICIITAGYKSNESSEICPRAGCGLEAHCPRIVGLRTPTSMSAVRFGEFTVSLAEKCCCFISVCFPSCLESNSLTSVFHHFHEPSILWAKRVPLIRVTHALIAERRY